MIIKRLLGKKVLFIGVIIYVFQVIAFIVYQMDGIGYMEFIKQNREYNLLVDELNNLSLEEQGEEINRLLTHEDSIIYLELHQKISYLLEYEYKMQDIMQMERHIEAFDIFQNVDSFSYTNMKKTIADFSRLKDVKLAIERDRVTSCIVDFTLLNYCVFGFMVYVLYEILRERDDGMWNLTHVTRMGRWNLIIYREISLSIIATVFYFLCFLTDLVLACVIYGKDDFAGYIQTIEAFENYTLPISKGCYLLLFASKSCFAILVLMMLAYTLFTIFRSRNTAAVFLLAIWALEWKFAKSISVYSNWNVFRNVNLMNILNCSRMDKEYQNLNWGGKAVLSSVVLLWVEIVLFLFSVVLIAIIYNSQYPSKYVRLKRIVVSINIFIQKALEKLSFGLKESYKIVVCKSSLMLLFIGIIICYWVVQKTEVVFPEVQQRMDGVYELYGGTDWESFDSYVKKLELNYEKNIEEIELLTQQIREGSKGAECVTEVSALQNQAATILIFLREFYEKQELRLEVKKNQDVDIFAISDRGYNEIIGSNSVIREIVIGLVLISLVSVFTSRVMSVEQQTHMKPLLRCTYRGIEWIWRKKMYSIWGILFLVICCIYGSNVHRLFQFYSTPYLDAPIQSLSFYAKSSFHVSIMQLMIWSICSRVVIMICAASSILYISSCNKLWNQMYIPFLIVLYSVIYAFNVIKGLNWTNVVISYGTIIASILFIGGTYIRWVKGGQ